MIDNVDRYINAALELDISRPTLKQLVNICHKPDKICVLGFNDYSKHLINIFGADKILVVDSIRTQSDLSFRGVRIHHKIEEVKEPFDVFLVVDYANIPLYQGYVYSSKSYASIPFKYPTSFGNTLTKNYDQFRQSEFYINLLSETKEFGNIDNSMMKREGVLLLLELLKGTLHIEGDIAEIGVWQGGSALYLAKALQKYNSNKKLYLFDFFEEHPSNHPKGIMCISELENRFSFNPYVEFVSGDIRKSITALDERKLSFVHYDMGYQKPILDTIVPRLQKGGIILLDNYGHTASKPTMFDSYFEKYKLKCMRIPYSEQCIVFKN